MTERFISVEENGAAESGNINRGRLCRHIYYTYASAASRVHIYAVCAQLWQNGERILYLG